MEYTQNIKKRLAHFLQHVGVTSHYLLLEMGPSKKVDLQDGKTVQAVEGLLHKLAQPGRPKPLLVFGMGVLGKQVLSTLTLPTDVQGYGITYLGLEHLNRESQARRAIEGVTRAVIQQVAEEREITSKTYQYPPLTQLPELSVEHLKASDLKDYLK